MHESAQKTHSTDLDYKRFGTLARFATIQICTNSFYTVWIHCGRSRLLVLEVLHEHRPIGRVTSCRRGGRDRIDRWTRPTSANERALAANNPGFRKRRRFIAGTPYAYRKLGRRPYR